MSTMFFFVFFFSRSITSSFAGKKKIWINMVTPALHICIFWQYSHPLKDPQSCSESMCRAQFIKPQVSSSFNVFTLPTPSPLNFFFPSALFLSSSNGLHGCSLLRVLGGLLKVEHVSSLVAFWDVNVRFCQRWDK